MIPESVYRLDENALMGFNSILERFSHSHSLYLYFRLPPHMWGFNPIFIRKCVRNLLSQIHIRFVNKPDSLSLRILKEFHLFKCA